MSSSSALAEGAAGRRRRPRRRTAAFLLQGVAGLAVLLGILSFYTRASAITPYTGVEWAGTTEGVKVVQVDSGSPAQVAGLLAGDVLLALDGRGRVTAREASEAPWMLVPDESLTLSISRMGRVVDLKLTPVWRESGSPLYAYLALLGLFFLASGSLLIHRLGSEPVANIYFFMSLAAFAFFVFSDSGEGTVLDSLFQLLDLAGRYLFPALLLHLAMRFPAGGRPRRPALALLYLPIALLAGASIWLVSLEGAQRLNDAVAAMDIIGASELLATALYMVGAFLVLAVRSSRATVPSARRQLRWAAWGTGLGTLPLVLLYLIPQALQVETPPVASLSMLLLLLLPLAFVTALLRYRLADLGLFVKGGITALTLMLFSLALFVVLNAALRTALGLPGIHRRVFSVLAGVLVFLLYPHLQRVVGELVDRAFYLSHYDYRKTLQQFARELNSERELLPLMVRFHDRIRRTLAVSRSVLLLPEPEGLRLLDTSCDLDQAADDDLIRADHPLLAELEASDSVDLDRDGRAGLPGLARRLGLQAFFPMRVKGRLVAVLAVALKDPEEEMNSEDRQLLVTLAAHAASAIEGARLYEENLERIREVGQLKDYHESIVESSRVGILVLDREGRITGWNRAMTDLFGQRKGRVLGRSAGEVFPPGFMKLLRDLPQAGRRVDRFAIGGAGGGSGGESGGDRGLRLFNLALAELHGPTGGCVVTFDEVSEQARMEQQLVQSERLAAVGLLASGVAHEINTPLTGIASYAQMLLDERGEEDPDREMLERIRKESWRASHIANSLLNFSRGGDDGFQEVDLNRIVEETLSLFAPQLKGRRIEVQFEPAPEPARVRGHQGRLQQVLLNLLLNARDAMPAGGEIRVRTETGNGRVSLRVADTGEGIPAEHLDRIYDPFFTTKKPGRGTGLGLSVSYGIVQDHKGTLEARSRHGRGSEFSVNLPALAVAPVKA